MIIGIAAVVFGHDKFKLGILRSDRIEQTFPIVRSAVTVSGISRKSHHIRRDFVVVKNDSHPPGNRICLTDAFNVKHRFRCRRDFLDRLDSGVEILGGIRLARCGSHVAID